jgi:hypothetical protein
MVTAGTKNKKIHGSSCSIGRSDATFVKYAWRKNRKSVTTTNTTKRM